MSHTMANSGIAIRYTTNASGSKNNPIHPTRGMAKRDGRRSERDSSRLIWAVIVDPRGAFSNRPQGNRTTIAVEGEPNYLD